MYGTYMYVHVGNQDYTMPKTTSHPTNLLRYAHIHNIIDQINSQSLVPEAQRLKQTTLELHASRCEVYKRPNLPLHQSAIGFYDVVVSIPDFEKVLQ